MTIGRRDFLAGAAMAAIGATTGGGRAAAAEAAAPITPPRKAVLKLSCQEGVMVGDTLAAKLDNAEKFGFDGFEVGGKGLPGRVKELKAALKGRSIKLSAICAGFDGVLGSDVKEQRDLAMKTMKEIMTAAGELGSTGLIIVPAFHGQTKLCNQELRELLVPLKFEDQARQDRQRSLLEELGDHGVKVGSRILLEPLNRRECFFLRTLADAAMICHDVNSPGIRMMGDLWHMTWEETSDLGAFISAGEYLHHVHIASRKHRRIPGEDGEADNYILGFKGLKWIGYQDYVSFECGSAGDKSALLPAAVKLLRKQWEEA